MGSLTASAPPSIPIWLDCDPGHDDVFAILLSLLPPLNLLGITTVHGNAPLPLTTLNCLRVLTAYGRTDVKVYPGAAAPVVRPAVFAPGIHGESGLDGTNLLPKEECLAEAGDAIEAMYTAIKACGPVKSTADGKTDGGAWLVTTGTLTNAYSLLSRFPDVVGYLHGVSIMGGAFNNPKGNMRPNAEFNIVADPEAARFVLQYEALQGKLYLVPLDLTHTVLATEDVRKRLLKDDVKGLRRMLYELLIFFAKTYEEVFGLHEGPPLHDPLAVAVLLKDVEPELWGAGRWVELDVVLEGDDVGRTVIVGEKNGVWIPTTIDSARFWDRMLKCVDEHEFRYKW